MSAVARCPNWARIQNRHNPQLRTVVVSSKSERAMDDMPQQQQQLQQPQKYSVSIAEIALSATSRQFNLDDSI